MAISYRGAASVSLARSREISVMSSIAQRVPDVGPPLKSAIGGAGGGG
jgi:hypothetical protein